MAIRKKFVLPDVGTVVYAARFDEDDSDPILWRKVSIQEYVVTSPGSGFITPMKPGVFFCTGKHPSTPGGQFTFAAHKYHRVSPTKEHALLRLKRQAQRDADKAQAMLNIALEELALLREAEDKLKWVAP